MDEHYFKDSPDNQPAPPDLSSSREGAAPSSSSGGPSGKRGAVRGGAAPRVSLYTRLGDYAGRNPWPDSPPNNWPPRPSTCTRCYGVFNTNPWRHDRKEGCERCDADRWAESPSYLDFRHHEINKGGRPAEGIRGPEVIQEALWNIDATTSCASTPPPRSPSTRAAAGGSTRRTAATASTRSSRSRWRSSGPSTGPSPSSCSAGYSTRAACLNSQSGRYRVKERGVTPTKRSDHVCGTYF